MVEVLRFRNRAAIYVESVDLVKSVQSQNWTARSHASADGGKPSSSTQYFWTLDHGFIGPDIRILRNLHALQSYVIKT